MDETADPRYAQRLTVIQMASWKKRLRKLDPYGVYLRWLRLGATLEVGCGIGRNLAFLRPLAVGVDHNETAIEACRQRGLTAFTPDELPSTTGTFDTLLFSHVLEHMTGREAVDLIDQYLPFLRPRGRVVIITPQERGFRADATHVEFMDFETVERVASTLRLLVVKQRSFPFPRSLGRWWIYNEFVTIAVRGE